MFLLLISLILNTVQAKSLCDPIGSKEMLSINVNGKSLVACGENSTGIVSDLQILNGEETVFEGDTAFKRYKVYKFENVLHIEEGLNHIDFKPFILLKWTCKSDKCEFQESKCLWKKGKIDENQVLNAKRLITKKSSISDSHWESLFIAILNGSKEALEVFQNPGKTSDASGSEALSTYLLDFPRLKKSGCL